MKRYILFILISILAITELSAQIADGITYQAVAIDDKGKEIAGMDINGNILHSKEIGVRFTIIENNVDGPMLYQETHETYTDNNGLFSLVIGHGENTGLGTYNKLTEINWGADKLFLKVELDVKNRGEYEIMGIQQMMAVPFAFHSFSTSSITGNDLDTSSINELQFLSISNDTIYLTNGGFVKLPQYDYHNLFNTPDFSNWDTIAADDFTGDFADLINIPTGLSDGDDNTQLTEAQVDAYADNNGYLKTESDPQFGLSPANMISDEGSGVVISSAERTKLNNLIEGAEVNVQIDWSEVDNTSDAYILNKPTLATVATSGSFVDLANIPTGLSDGDDNTQLTEAQVDAYANNNGYLKTEIDPVFAAWDKSTGISIAESQISNLTHFTNSDEIDPIYSSAQAALITDAGSGIVISNAERTKLNNVIEGAEINVQSDWNETNNASDAFILNKPTLATVATSGSFTDLTNIPTGLLDGDDNTQLTETQVDTYTDNNGYLKTESDPQFGLSAANMITDAGSGVVISSTERTKLNNVIEGAEINVQSDWNEVDNTSDAYILNKPTLSTVATSGSFADLANIPTGLSDGDDNTQLTEAQVDAYADNNGYLKTESDPQFGLSPANMISDEGSGVVISSAERTKLNNLTEGAEINVQSDWNESDITNDSYIANKPTNVSAFTNDASYLMSESDPAFSAWDKSTGISITESQISNLTHFTNSDETDPIYTSAQASSITDAGSGVVISNAERTKLDNLTEVRDIADEFNAYAGQTIFTLSQIPSVTCKVKMYINGIRISNAAYSLTDNVLTYIPTNNGLYILVAGDRIQFDYSY